MAQASLSTDSGLTFSLQSCVPAPVDAPAGVDAAREKPNRIIAHACAPAPIVAPAGADAVREKADLDIRACLRSYTPWMRLQARTLSAKKPTWIFAHACAPTLHGCTGWRENLAGGHISASFPRRRESSSGMIFRAKFQLLIISRRRLKGNVSSQSAVPGLDSRLRGNDLSEIY
jgi:hypothetical protein